MRSKDALMSALTAAIAAAGVGTPLKNVYLFGSPRGSVEAAEKVIRIDITDGVLIRTDDETRKEQNIGFKIQHFVRPAEAGSLESEDEAADAAFDLLEAVFNYLHSNPTLSGEITDIDIPEDEANFEKGMANLGGTRYGAANLYGIINPY